MYTNSITSKGQVTIPKALRDYLGLDKIGKASFSINDRQEVVISAPKTLEEVRAMLQEPTTPQKLSAKERLIADQLIKKYGVR